MGFLSTQWKNTLVVKFLKNLYFCRTIPLLFKNFWNKVPDSDLCESLVEENSALLGEKLEVEWLKKKSNLWEVLFKLFGSELIKIGFVVFVKAIIFELSKPVLIYQIIIANKDDPNAAKIYAILLIISIFLQVFLYNYSNYKLRLLAVRIQLACSSLIYRKTLKLNETEIDQVTSGKIVTLLSNDMYRFDKLFFQIHYLWIGPLQIFISFFLFWRLLGINSTVGLILLVVVSPIQIFLGKVYSNYRAIIVICTEKRISLINEFLSGIQVIKMYLWEKIYSNLIDSARKKELRNIGLVLYLKAVQNAITKFLNQALVFSSLVVQILTGHHLSSPYVFAVKAFYNVITQNVGGYFIEAVKDFSEILISQKRLENLLKSSEIQVISNHSPNSEVGLSLKNGTTNWCLQNLNFKAKSGQFVVLMGDIGSGKTSLIYVLLQELPLVEGMLKIEGKISYSSQESWIFTGTIRENILFGENFEEKRYNDVIKVCALNHDFHNFSFGDQSMVGPRGMTLSGGQKARINLARSVYRKADIYILDDPFGPLDVAVGKEIFQNCIHGFLKEKCVILSTHQVQYLQDASWIYLLQNGKVQKQGSYEFFQKDNGVSTKENTVSEKVHQIEHTESGKELEFMEINRTGKISCSTYRKYMLSLKWYYFIFIAFLLVLFHVLQAETDYFESKWVHLEEIRNNSMVQKGEFASIKSFYTYTGLVIGILVISIFVSLLFFHYFLKTSVKLHNNMLFAVLKAKLQIFYTSPSGSILNKFARDTEVVDTKIAKEFIDTIHNVLGAISVMVLVSWVRPLIAINSCILIIIFFLIKEVYLATSRHLKRIEATSRSPIYSHLNETLQGLTTIRAAKAQNRNQKKFESLLNKNGSISTLYLSIYATFTLWSNLLCALYITLVTVISIWGKEKMDGSKLGLVISQALNLTNFIQWGMTQWSELENDMVSVERILDLSGVESEEEGPTTGQFPQDSSIIFQDVSVQYKKDGPYALDVVSFRVNPGEKIGIIGRSGAGKTSLISVLFRFVPFEGQVLIGGVKIQDLSLEKLRANISIIPQDPFIMSGSIRENLDPQGHHSDKEIWQVLEKVTLKNNISDLDKSSNLSLGQKQLLCLARSLLNQNRIIIFDEITAYVDYKTEAVIHKTIKESFQNCTRLVIAHRLHTILDCDRILVLENGKVVKFQTPAELLQDPEFSRLIHKK